MNCELVFVMGYPSLIGNGEGELVKEKVFGLEVGTKVNQVGRRTANGKISSSCRIMEFSAPSIYSGIYNHDGDRFMAFLLAPEEFENCKEDDRPDYFYALFLIIGEESEHPELLRQNYNKNSIMIYKPVFDAA